jgi:hypothetical protein
MVAYLVPTTEGLRFCFVVDYSCGIILTRRCVAIGPILRLALGAAVIGRLAGRTELEFLGVLRVIAPLSAPCAAPCFQRSGNGHWARNATNSFARKRIAVAEIGFPQ